MYPYFVIGYFFCKKKDIVNEYIEKIRNSYLLVGLLVIYAMLMVFYKTDSYIYISGYSLIGKDIPNQLLIDMHRFIVGLVGSALVIVLVNKLVSKTMDKSKWLLLTKFGIESLGIYIISGYFNIILMKVTGGLHFNYLFVIIESIIILTVSYFITLLIKKFNFSNNLLLGGR